MSKIFKPSIFFGAIAVVCGAILAFSDIILLGDGQGINNLLGLDIFYWYRLKGFMAICTVLFGGLWVLFSLSKAGDFLANVFGTIFERPVEMLLCLIVVGGLVFTVLSGSSASFLVAGLASDFGIVELDQTALAEFTKDQPVATATDETKLSPEERQKRLEKLAMELEKTRKEENKEGDETGETTESGAANVQEQFMEEVKQEWIKAEASSKKKRKLLGLQ